MNILTLDVEHGTKSFAPHEDNFYLSFVGILWNNQKEEIWFDHKNKEPTPKGISIIQDYIDKSDVIVCHNMKHELNVLRAYGINFENITLWCTMLTEYLLCGQDKQTSYSLNATAERYGFESKFDKVKTYWDNGIDTYEIPDYILAHTAYKIAN